MNEGWAPDFGYALFVGPHDLSLTNGVIFFISDLTMPEAQDLVPHAEVGLRTCTHRTCGSSRET